MEQKEIKDTENIKNKNKIIEQLGMRDILDGTP